MKTIVYIIGHRSSDEDRLRNLKTTIEWLTKLIPTCLKHGIILTILIIEQDSKKTLEEYTKQNSEISYIFAYNPGYYNRGWAFNIGFRKFSHADYFFFADNDIIMNNNDMMHVFKNCFEYEAVSPYETIYDSTKEFACGISDCGKIDIHKLEKNKDIHGEREGVCFSGGVMGISKNAMYLISGWDERFRGRGWEDYAFTAKIMLFLKKLHVFPLKALHLWHSWEINTTININSELNKEYEKYTVDDYVNQIHNSAETFGSVLKYCSDVETGLSREYDSYSCGSSVIAKSNTCSSICAKSNTCCSSLCAKSNKFKERYKRACCIYRHLLKIVNKKHNKNKRVILYYNLCGQHDCQEHKKDDTCDMIIRKQNSCCKCT